MCLRTANMVWWSKGDTLNILGLVGHIPRDDVRKKDDILFRRLLNMFKKKGKSRLVRKYMRQQSLKELQI